MVVLPCTATTTIVKDSRLYPFATRTFDNSFIMILSSYCHPSASPPNPRPHIVGTYLPAAATLAAPRAVHPWPHLGVLQTAYPCLLLIGGSVRFTVPCRYRERDLCVTSNVNNQRREWDDDFDKMGFTSDTFSCVIWHELVHLCCKCDIRYASVVDDSLCQYVPSLCVLSSISTV